MKPLATGIFGIIGVPGSGKSLMAVREIVQTVMKDRRPCYTNIPIVPKTMRAYIFLKLRTKKKQMPRRERRAVAQLVKPISQEHFHRFCQRLELIDLIKERIQKKMDPPSNDLNHLAEFQTMEAVKRSMRIVARIHGKPVIAGKNADWIPPGSCLFLDELHKWYPSKNYRDEDPAIVALTSMHRHMQLKIFVLTQRWMNASLSFRSMAEQVWYCMNWSKKPIIGFIRLHRFINIFRYVHFNGVDIEERTGMPGVGARPTWSELYCPEWTGGVEYDLYRSHSHVGTLEEQRAEMDAVVTAMMGSKHQKQIDETIENEDDMSSRNKDSWSKKVNRYFTWLCVLTLVFMVGRMSKKADPVETPTVETVAIVEPETQPEENEQPESPVEPEPQPEPEPYQPPAVRLSGVRQGTATIAGNNYGFGDTYDEMELLALDPQTGQTIWVGPGPTIFRWDIGRLPRRGVLPPAVRAQLAERLNALADQTP
jgi:hypothetical protein